METLVLAFVLAGFLQRVGADWWSGVTGKELPSQVYRRQRHELRVQRYAVAGKPPPARHPVRQYTSDMWAYTWDALSERQRAWWEERQDVWRQRRDTPRAKPLRDHVRVMWHTGPAHMWHLAWNARSQKRWQRLESANEQHDHLPAADATERQAQSPVTEPTGERATVIPFHRSEANTKEEPTHVDETTKEVEATGDARKQQKSSAGRKSVMTTTMNGEVTGLASARQYVQAMAEATRQGSNSIEQAMSGLLSGEVSGRALEYLTSAQEALALAAEAFGRASAVLDRHQDVAEAYSANPDAGSKKFSLSE